MKIISVVLIGEREEYTSSYIKKIIAMPHIIVWSTYDELETPCPLKIVTACADEMRQWAHAECIKKIWNNLTHVRDIVILPHDRMLDDKALQSCLKKRDLYDSVNMECRVYCADILDDLIPKKQNGVNNITVFSIPSFSANSIPFQLPFPAGDIKCICIPSIIHVKDPSRSVFSSNERLKHTIRQLKSIKKYVYRPYVILLELSELTPKEMHALSQWCDWVWSFASDPIVQRMAHVDPNKNKAEVYVLKKAFTHMATHCPNATHFAKFGGRYWFSSHATHTLFNNVPVMKQAFAECYQQPIIEPVFYSIPRSHIQSFIGALDVMQEKMQFEFTDNERLLWDVYASQIKTHNPECQHIRGYTATGGVFRYF